MSCRLHRALLRWATNVAVVALCLSLGSAPVRAQQTRSVAVVKAAMIYNFLKFVRWTGPRSISTEEPFEICVPGDDPIGEVLERNVGSRTAQGRGIVLRRTSGRAALTSCDLVFLAASTDDRVASVLASVQGSPTLTVGESKAFFDEGGMIRLVIADNRLVFDVNLDAAKAAGLSISSQLLKLARTIKSED